MMIDVPVLIVGGGPVGLTASLLLSQRGVKSLLVDKHPGTAVLPKARGINARTMEMYRQLGLEDDIRAAGMPPEFSKMILWAKSLAGHEIKRLTPGRGSAESQPISPVTNCGCAQDVFEPVVRRHAEQAGMGTLNFGVEMAEFRFNADGIEGLLLDRQTNRAEPFRARYLIAADGAQSKVRRQLGVNMVGEVGVYDSVNIHLRADLTQWVAHRPASLYLIEQPDLRATFLTINGRDRWGFLVTSLSVYGFKPEDFTPKFCANVVRQAVGVSELDVEVLGVNAWKASAIVADQFRHGPVFLAGDSAHEMPPTGGFGLNTGVQDVQNLCWKLAAVLQGHADESLLDTYDVERRPQAEKITQVSLLNALSMGRRERQTEVKLPRSEYLNERGLIFGARYESAAVIPDGTLAGDSGNAVTDYAPSAYPGCRAPHMWLSRGGGKISTIDLFGRDFVLLAGPEGAAWQEVASRNSSVTIHTYVVGSDVLDLDGALQEVYGLKADGAVLVRPDGYVAWRSCSLSSNPASEFGAALERVLCRGSVNDTLA